MVLRENRRPEQMPASPVAGLSPAARLTLEDACLKLLSIHRPAPGGAVRTFLYNHDLLLDDADLTAAAEAYPAIFPALDHEALRRRFRRVDDEANRMKASSSRLGLISIALVAWALIGASTAHVTEALPGARLLAGLAVLGGLIGVLIGGLGVMHSRRKDRWLWLRFETERLRQFFFQTHVVLAPDILRAAASGHWQDFHAIRAAAFARFEQTLNTELREQFDLSLQDMPGRDPPPDRWLIRQPSPAALSEDSPAVHQLREAYRCLRLDGQRAFSQHKLGKSGAWFSTQPADQLQTLKWVGGSAILATVLLHLILAGALFGAWWEGAAPWLHIVAIWLAVVALAVRTIDEGMRPGREIERYRAYRDGSRNILQRFDQAATMAEALHAMREMEELSYDEMIAFLRTNKEGSFAM